MDVHKKKEKKAQLSREEWLESGEQWIYTCIKRDSYFFTAFGIGKWTQETCRTMFEQFARRLDPPTFKYRLSIFSDGNDDYTYVLPEFFNKDSINYGQLLKIKENGRLVRKIHRVVYGKLDLDNIETTDNENFNSILRDRIGRLVRKTKCYTKKKTRLINVVNIFQFYWNFIKILREKMTPAMLEHQTHKIWTWGNLLHAKLRYTN